MKKCCHWFIDTGRTSIEYNPQTGTFFEDVLKSGYQKTYVVDYNKVEYKILKCKYCGKEWEIPKDNFENFINDLKGEEE